LTPSKPADTDAEVVVFGKGIGESVLVHLGDNRWLIVDSFITDNRAPVALEYLENIGVDPSTAVCAVVVTHWHDDHINGMAKILESCPSAMFCCPQAMTTCEFVRYVQINATRNMMVAGSGTKELQNVFEVLARKNADQRLLKYATADKRIWDLEGCEIWCLSPSDEQYTQFLAELTSLMPEINKPKRRIVPFTPNNNSIVIQVCWGAESILLGADLENTSSPRSGWTAVVSSTGRPQHRSTVFKIPHHGSENAHSEDAWESLLEPNVIAATSPFAKGKKKLPAPSDISRILAKTDNAFLAKKRIKSVTKGSSSVVAKMIREATKNYEEFEKGYGFVRMRKEIGSKVNWSIDLSPEACHFSDL